MHPCPTCGKETDGSCSEGGLKWAICEACMTAEQERNKDNPYFDPAYQAFVEDMAQYCHCEPSSERPCDGVLAGGVCDMRQEQQCDQEIAGDPQEAFEDEK